jgi:hypothetical protein
MPVIEGTLSWRKKVDKHEWANRSKDERVLKKE